MPQVKNHKFIIRDYSDSVIYVPAYEVPLAKMKHRAPRKGAKPGKGGAIEEFPITLETPVALTTREVTSIDAEWERVGRIYSFDLVSKVYVDKSEFVAAVEKALLAFSSTKAMKPEITTKFKGLGISAEQGNLLAAAGFSTLESVKAADLASLSSALKIPADKAAAMRAKWNGEEVPTDPIAALVGAADNDE